MRDTSATPLHTKQTRYKRKHTTSNAPPCHTPHLFDALRTTLGHERLSAAVGRGSRPQDDPQQGQQLPEATHGQRFPPHLLCTSVRRSDRTAVHPSPRRAADCGAAAGGAARHLPPHTAAQSPPPAPPFRRGTGGGGCRLESPPVVSRVLWTVEVQRRHDPRYMS